MCFMLVDLFMGACDRAYIKDTDWFARLSDTQAYNLCE